MSPAWAWTLTAWSKDETHWPWGHRTSTKSVDYRPFLFIYSRGPLQAAVRAKKMLQQLPLSMLRPSARGGRETKLTALLWQLVWSPGKMRVFNMLALWLENMAGSPSLQGYPPVGWERCMSEGGLTELIPLCRFGNEEKTRYCTP